MPLKRNEVVKYAAETQVVESQSASVIPFAIKGAASQSSALIELRSSANSVLASVDSVGKLVLTRELRVSGTTDTGQLRLIGGNYGLIVRNDGSDVYFLFTNSGDQTGHWSSLRPFAVNNATGLVKMSNGLEVTGTFTTDGYSVARTIHQDGSLQFLGNSVADFTPLSVTIPAALLGTNRSLRVSCYGYYYNNSGSNKTIRLRIDYGATTLVDDITPNLSSSGNSRAWKLDFFLSASNATNAQSVGGSFSVSGPSSSTAGIVDLAVADTVTERTFHGSSSIDSTASQSISVTFNHNAASIGTFIYKTYEIVVLQ